jgi:hypothetical protein
MLSSPPSRGFTTGGATGAGRVAATGRAGIGVTTTGGGAGGLPHPPSSVIIPSAMTTWVDRRG